MGTYVVLRIAKKEADRSRQPRSRYQTRNGRPRPSLAPICPTRALLKFLTSRLTEPPSTASDGEDIWPDTASQSALRFRTPRQAWGRAMLRRGQHAADEEDAVEADRPRVSGREKSATHMEMLAAARDDSTLLINHDERVQPGAVFPGPHRGNERSVVPRNPDLYLALDQAADEQPFVPRQTLGAVKPVFRATRRQTVWLTVSGIRRLHRESLRSGRRQRGGFA